MSVSSQRISSKTSPIFKYLGMVVSLLSLYPALFFIISSGFTNFSALTFGALLLLFECIIFLFSFSISELYYLKDEESIIIKRIFTQKKYALHDITSYRCIFNIFEIIITIIVVISIFRKK